MTDIRYYVLTREPVPRQYGPCSLLDANAHVRSLTAAGIAGELHSSAQRAPLATFEPESTSRLSRAVARLGLFSRSGRG